LFASPYFILQEIIGAEKPAQYHLSIMRKNNIFFEPEGGMGGKKMSAKPDGYYWGENVLSSNTASDTETAAIFLGAGISTKKLIALQAFVILFVAALFGKSFYLQILKTDKYAGQSDANRMRILPIAAERGIIYDRNRTPLVSNEPDFYLAISPKDLPQNMDNRQNLIQQVANVINIPAESIEETLADFSSYKYQSVPIKNNLSYEEALKIEILNNKFPALLIENGIKRKYAATPAMSHILGYLRRVDKDDLKTHPDYLLRDDIGKAGVEMQYEDILRGQYGKKQIEVDASGRQTVILAKEDPKPGRDIVLTIDLDLQKKTEEILNKHLAAAGLKKAVVIVSDVRNGEILTMASLPAFDNNVFSGGLSGADYANISQNPNQPLFNRALSGEYPSGSIIKPVFAAAALEEGIINETTTVNSVGGIKIDKWFFPDWKAGGHGITDVKKALAESVNTFFYIIGGGLLDASWQNFTRPGLGIDKLTFYAKKFGLGAKLGIDLPSEAAGFLPSKKWKKDTKGESWYIGDTYHFAIGQGDLLVTPLQANSWTATLANGGIIYQPHLVKSYIQSDGGEGVVAPKIKNINFISKKNIDIVNAGLRDGVTKGSSRQLAALPVSVAGKTGTAQWGVGKKTHAWFTGFAPYENPEIAITVLIEGGGEGSSVAVPIAKEILYYYFTK
jgi:penicillin-binding protein 2